MPAVLFAPTDFIMMPMELTRVAEAVSKSRIAGLGESTHGTHEFFDFKSRLLRLLIADHGFNTLLFEDSPDACRPIGDYIAGQDIDLAFAQSQLYPVWQTEELRRLFVWLKKYWPSTKVAFAGFDIDQTKRSDLSLRDELMAGNIKAYCQANPNAKAVVWAHNSHVQSIGSDIQPRPMGSFLKEHFGDRYKAVALLFGKGGVSATRLKNSDMLSRDRSLGVIKIGSPPDYLAESELDALTDAPIFIAQDQVERLNLPNKVRSIGWGLVPESANEAVEESDLKRAFDYVVYYPQGTSSRPLPGVKA